MIARGQHQAHRAVEALLGGVVERGAEPVEIDAHGDVAGGPVLAVRGARGLHARHHQAAARTGDRDGDPLRVGERAQLRGRLGDDLGRLPPADHGAELGGGHLEADGRDARALSDEGAHRLDRGGVGDGALGRAGEHGGHLARVLLHLLQRPHRPLRHLVDHLGLEVLLGEAHRRDVGVDEQQRGAGHGAQRQRREQQHRLGAERELHGCFGSPAGSGRDPHRDAGGARLVGDGAVDPAGLAQLGAAADEELDAPVLGPALAGDVGHQRPPLPEAPRLQPARVDAVLDEPEDHGQGALIGERLVAQVVPAVVGVPVDRDPGDLRVGLEDGGHLLEHGEAVLGDGGLGGVEVDLLEDDDLRSLDADRGAGGAAVELGVGVGRALVVGAGVLVVGDAVAVAVAGAAVLLRVAAGDAGHVGAGVLGVGDAVAIAIGWAAAAVGAGGGVADDGRAGVLGVGDAVAVGVERRRRGGRCGVAGAEAPLPAPPRPLSSSVSSGQMASRVPVMPATSRYAGVPGPRPRPGPAARPTAIGPMRYRPATSSSALPPATWLTTALRGSPREAPYVSSGPTVRPKKRPATPAPPTTWLPTTPVRDRGLEAGARRRAPHQVRVLGADHHAGLVAVHACARERRLVARGRPHREREGGGRHVAVLVEERAPRLDAHVAHVRARGGAHGLVVQAPRGAPFLEEGRDVEVELDALPHLDAELDVEEGLIAHPRDHGAAGDLAQHQGIVSVRELGGPDEAQAAGDVGRGEREEGVAGGRRIEAIERAARLRGRVCGAGGRGGATSASERRPA